MPNIVFVLGLIGVVSFVLLISGYPERCPHCARWFARVVTERWYQSEETVEIPINDSQNSRKVAKKQYQYKVKYTCKFCRRDWIEATASYYEQEVGVLKVCEVSAEKTTLRRPWWKKMAWATGLGFSIFMLSFVIYDPQILMEPPDKIHEYLRYYFAAILAPFNGSTWASRQALLQVVEARWILEYDVEKFHQNNQGGSWEQTLPSFVASGTFDPPVWPSLPPDSAESLEGQVRVKEKRAFYNVVFREEISGKLYSTDHLFRKRPNNQKGIDPVPLDAALFLKLQKSSTVWKGEIQESPEGNYFLSLEQEN